MFRLEYIYGPFGDCTSDYKVRLDKPYTVSEFVQEVLSRDDEWGNIYIGNNLMTCVYVCGYKHGVLTSEVDESFKDLKVTSASAHGGWSLMDYYLSVESKGR